MLITVVKGTSHMFCIWEETRGRSNQFSDKKKPREQTFQTWSSTIL